MTRCSNAVSSSIIRYNVIVSNHLFFFQQKATTYFKYSRKVFMLQIANTMTIFTLGQKSPGDESEFGADTKFFKSLQG